MVYLVNSTAVLGAKHTADLLVRGRGNPDKSFEAIMLNWKVPQQGNKVDKFSEAQDLHPGQAACCECPHIDTTLGPGMISAGTVSSPCPCCWDCQAGEILWVLVLHNKPAHFMWFFSSSVSPSV